MRLQKPTILAITLFALTGADAVQAQVTPSPTQGQQIPGLPAGITPQQAAQMLQQRPEMGRLIQQRLQASGMTPDEIRTRLRAAGYPSTMLDAYLGADTTGLPVPNRAMVQAISLLGLAQFSARDSLLLAGDTLAYRLYVDSLRADSVSREDSLARVRKGLPVFGLDVFRQATTQFQSVVSGPVDDDYLLGPGDVLVLILTGGVEDAQTLEVTRAGFMVIPRVGQLYVNNLTLGQLRDVLYERLSRVYSGVTRSADARTKFVITVANVRMLTVRVAGEVGRPGSYQVPATGSVLTAIYQAGGLTERAGFRQVEVRRGADLVGTVDLYDYLTRGITPTSMHLSSGDVVYVPVQGARVKVVGEVKRPAIYEARPGDGLREMVAIAGGLTPVAATSIATIDRILPPDQRPDFTQARTVISVNLAKVLAGDTAAVPLAAGDSITIYPFVAGRRNAVSIRGAVAVPGTYQLDPGMRLTDLITRAGGVRPDVYTGRAQILRTDPDSTKRMIGVAVPAGAGDENPRLAERDEVTVFAKSDFRPDRYVAVWGAVRSPGYLPYADSMTVRDAILMAGGLTEDASLDSVQVSRFRGGAAGDSLVTVFSAQLDASFVVGQPGYPPQATAGQAPTIVLGPYDQVLVRHRVGWDAPGTVVITGEVRYPGHYPVLSKDERLITLLNQAGGLTSAGYADGIQFFRSGGGRRSALGGTAAARDTIAPIPGTTSRKGDVAPMAMRELQGVTWVPPGRIGVDLVHALRNPSDPDNLLVQAGDSVHIPRYIPFVRVEGAVNAPGTNVPFRGGAGAKSYVNWAGGFIQVADKKGTWVLQPNGMVEKGGVPRPGAVVVVPWRAGGLPPTGTNFLQVLGAVIAPLVSAATTIAIVIITRP